MSEIVRLDEHGQLDFRYRTTINNLAKALVNGECLIFLGAGASVDPKQPDLPTGAELSQTMAQACELKWHEDVPLSTMAFYYEFYNKRNGLNSLLREKIGDKTIKPSTSIERLVEMVDLLDTKWKKAPFVITTNYDQHFENAYRDHTTTTENAKGREANVVVYNGACDSSDKAAKLYTGVPAANPQYWAPGPGVYLYKLHGCISQITPQTIHQPTVVITEEDYVNFLANATSVDDHKRILYSVRGLLATRTILFVGYSLADWNFRVILKASLGEGAQQQSFAVQYFDPRKGDRAARTRWEAIKDFWGPRKIDIINSDAALCMTDLRDAVSAHAPLN